MLMQLTFNGITNKLKHCKGGTQCRPWPVCWAHHIYLMLHLYYIGIQHVTGWNSAHLTTMSIPRATTKYLAVHWFWGPIYAGDAGYIGTASQQLQDSNCCRSITEYTSNHAILEE